MSTLIAEFVAETTDNLDRVDQDFVALEKQPDDPEILARIFRALHTIKGSCGFLGFARLEALAHSGESLLGMLRDGSIQLTPAITTTLLQTMDAVRRSLSVIESSGSEGDVGHDPLVARLDALREGRELVAPANPQPISPAAAVEKGLPPATRAAAPAASTEPETSPKRTRDAAGKAIAAHERIETLRQALIDLDRAFIGTAGSPAALPTLADRFGGLAQAAAGHAAVVDVAQRAVQLARGPESSAVRHALLEAAAFADQCLADLDATGTAPTTIPGALLAQLDEAAAGPRPVPTPSIQQPAVPMLEALTAVRTSAPASPGSKLDPAAASAASDARPAAGSTTTTATATATNTRPATSPDALSNDALREDVSGRRGTLADSKIRVDVKLLDNLMNQVGELVLARNQILQALTSRDARVTARMTQRLSQITTDLQASVMRTRLQPMEIVWNRIPRTVRDLSLELGKRVDLTMEGADTELDRSLLDAIRDPMTHLVRNAIDHGLETEVERVAAGKNPIGQLSLRAWHEGGQVNIEIVDDGRGIDVGRIERKAIERGIITHEQARTLSHKDKIALIFLPGFSTAEQITTVSGRGVGMDVVKHNIDQVNGAIDIHTEVGRGTAIRLKIPLTLAIIPALIVASGGERYVIPQVSLMAVVSLSGESVERGIERVHDAAVFRWRGRLLPIVDMNDVLKQNGQARTAESITIVVLQAADRLFGLRVDAVVDSAEVVVKPVNRVLTRNRVFAAATIMGDGRAAMILDVLGLAQRAAVVTGRADQSSQSRAASGSKTETATTRPQVLVVRVRQELAIIPLSSSIRLEHISASAVENLGSQTVAQYRGRVLPLRNVDGNGLSLSGTEDVLNVVVYIEGDHCIGLVVDELVDILQQPGDLQPFRDRRAAVLGGMIVLNRVAQVLDLPAMAREAWA